MQVWRKYRMGTEYGTDYCTKFWLRCMPQSRFVQLAAQNPYRALIGTFLGGLFALCRRRLYEYE